MSSIKRTYVPMDSPQADFWWEQIKRAAKDDFYANTLIKEVAKVVPSILNRVNVQREINTR